ncbi:MAG: LptA/OstA family protein [Verrucomicrobiota bacterium]
MRLLGFSLLLLFVFVTTLPADREEEEIPQRQSTVISSDRLEVINTDEGNLFIFDGSVSIVGADFTAKCDRMEVRTNSEGEDDFGAIAVIEAIGNVQIQQGIRIATAGKAIIYPQSDEVFLEESPQVRDENGTISGYRMTLHGEDRRISIEPGPDGSRTQVELPSLEVIRSDKSGE